MNQINRVTIVGMGAMGVMYGHFFEKALGADKVAFLLDGIRMERFHREGMYCNGEKCLFQASDPKQESVQEAQLLIFAVKAAGLEAAVELARPVVGRDTVILSVINGISSEEYIESHLEQGTVITCISQGMDAVKAGNQMTYDHIGTIHVGIMPQESQKAPALEAVEELFVHTGLPHCVEEDMLRRLWCKWMLNVGLNQTTMVTEGNYGTVQRPGEARELMQAAMREVIALAEKAGVNVTEKDLEEYVILTDTLNPQGMPSMRQDGLAGRRSEVELFAGEVIRKGEQYGVDVPVNRMLYQRVQEMEAKYE